jgi:Zn finger protein HypA/HybF involved in hydrogenase expression
MFQPKSLIISNTAPKVTLRINGAVHSVHELCLHEYVLHCRTCNSTFIGRADSTCCPHCKSIDLDALAYRIEEN